MPVLRITKRYNNLSKKHGILEVDKVRFENRDDAAAWLLAVTKARGVDFEVVDAEWVLVDLATGAEIIDNPTGGFVGVIPQHQKHLLK